MPPALSILLISLLAGSPALASDRPCLNLLESPTVETQLAEARASLPWFHRTLWDALEPRLHAKILRDCPDPETCAPDDLERLVTESIQEAADQQISLGRDVRQLIIIVAAMAGSTMLSSSEMSARLPEWARNFSQILSGIAMYVVGAPVLERVMSAVRFWSYANGGAGLTAVRNRGGSEELKRLEAMFRATQVNYSTNAQMSRNVVAQFLLGFKDDLRAARRSLREGDPDYAADQLAEAALRMRRLYAEIPPDDPSVVLAARAVFAAHAKERPALRRLVLARITALDPESEPDTKAGGHFDRLASAWLPD